MAKPLLEEETEHAGAWKIALADLMTAMMAFFLVMWLLASSDDQTLKGISEYFTEDRRGQKLDAGSGGILAGRSIRDAEKLPDSADAVARQRDNSQAELLGVPANVQSAKESEQLAISNSDEGVEQLRRMFIVHAASKELLARVTFSRDREGLIIEIMDLGEKPMFSMGTSVPTEEAKALLENVAMAIRALPNEIVLRGHTDSYKFKSVGREQNNWHLSAMRAEQARVLLETSGIGSGRVVRIEGHADLKPTYPEDMLDPRNRRIAIVLRDVTPTKEEAAPVLPQVLWVR